MTGRRTRTGAELDGFREGLVHALADRRRQGLIDPTADRWLHEADEALARGALEDAERTLLALDRRLREATPERELAEYPRGLVAYTPTDGPEAPTPPEEDPIRNRLMLLERLADVRASQGHDVDSARRTLREAEAHLAAGDRAGARRIGEGAQAELERLDQDPRSGSASRRDRDR